jgi:ferric-dicitrate binding protein FerR (iron transport regulator)
VTDTSHRKAGPILGRLRESLHADADPGPARLELERRKLIATIASGPRPARRFKSGVAVGAAVSLAAAAAVIFVLAVTAAPPGGEPPARISGLVGAGALSHGGTARVPASDGAKLTLADGTALWLAAETTVSSPDGGKHRIRLETGRALAHVAPRSGPARFMIETEFGDIEVRGTVFSARIAAAGLTIDLYEGSIRFSSGGRSVDVRPGESLRVGKGGSIDARVPIDRAAVLADLLITEKTAALPGALVPKLAPPAETDSANPVIERRKPPFPPGADASAAPTDAKRPTRRAAAAVKAPDVVAPSAGAVEPVPFADPALAEIEIETAPPADEKLFLDAYEKAVSGEPEDARALLERYLASYPEGRYWQRVADILGESP